ncbi:MAG: sugar phosphate isomerase/epimerase, partial [Planctomycetales bacterium]|nr:sugar phosphate isomerase/epimerase [Planctomycetales bacterium]
MPNSSNRRHFLHKVSLATGALAVGAADLSPARAIEPVVRTDGHHFKFSLAAYSYRNLLSGQNPQLTLVDFVDDCARFGLEGAELTSYYFPASTDETYCRTIKAECFRRGLDVSGTAVGNDFCHAAGAKRDEAIAHVKTWIDRADWMDAPVIRIFSGNTKSGQTREEAHRLAVEAIEECCEYAGTKGVFLALENHGGLTAEASGLLALVRDVQSPWFGVNLDTGNFHSSDVYAELEQLAPYALNVQVKVVVKPAGGSAQPADFQRL